MNFLPLRFGLQSKVILAFALVGLLPLAFATYRLVDLNKHAFSEQVLRVHALASQSTAERIESYLNGIHTLAISAASNPTLYTNPMSAEAQQFQADLLASGPPEWVGIVSLSQRQEEMIRVQKKGLDATLNHLISKGRPGEIRLVQHQNLPWLVVSAEIPNQGDLRFFVTGSHLREIMDPTELGDNASMVLAESQGNILLASSPDLEIPTGILTLGQSRHVSGSGKFDHPSGEKVLGAHAPLTNPSWSVLTWQPLSVAEQVALSMRKRAWESVALALFIAGILSLLAYLSVVRPIRALLGGNLGSGGGDEIKQLERAFAMLSKKEEDPGNIEDVFLGRYKVLEKLGQGGMGTVFHGWDPKLERPIALKTLLLNSQVSQDKTHELVNKLLREATTAANLNHPNIVCVYDVRDARQYAYVAMEFVDGCSLADYLEHHGPLPPKQAMALFVQVARGLIAAHEKGIVHRDIKPANILLGSDHSVKIADFGISQLLTSLENREASVAGTPGFLSPEVLRGEPFTEAADLFALGATMYRAVTGYYPFQGATVRGILERTLKTTPRHPGLLNKDIPKSFADLILRLLEKDPSQRLTNTNVLIYGLETLADGERWIYKKPPIFDDVLEMSETVPEEIRHVATLTRVLKSDSTV